MHLTVVSFTAPSGSTILALRQKTISMGNFVEGTTNRATTSNLIHLQYAKEHKYKQTN